MLVGLLWIPPCYAWVILDPTPLTFKALQFPSSSTGDEFNNNMQVNSIYNKSIIMYNNGPKENQFTEGSVMKLGF